MSKILVFAEQRDGKLKKVAFENLSLGKKLSTDLGAELVAVLIGNNISGLGEQLGKYGALKVIACQNDALDLYQPEGYAKILADTVTAEDASIVIMGATLMGKDLAPRVAARLDAALATDCISVEVSEGDLKIVRPIYAGKVRATIRLKSDKKLLTVRPNVYPAEENPESTEVIEVAADPCEIKTKVTEVMAGSKDKLDVTEADIIVSGGRGLKDPDNFHLIANLADKLGAAQGASRAAVDAGWRLYEEQVGQTGKTVSPSLYIAVGISGAIQHLAGMSSSKYIVAINKDPEAPIFKIADYGIVGDLFEVVPKMIEML
ncbi:MAG: electron transfer flavoprotein subunit alpha/FixB family protein [Calditrichia bacterium]|nr:electron transfer flavoprotein subunit alpha/FixB family protein [Calditrichia bacterium]